MRFAICNEIFRDWPIERILTYAAELGYDAVEVAPFTLASRVTELGAERRAAIREAAGRAGIQVSGIHWVLAQTEGFHLTDPDPAIRSRTADYLVDLVDFCGDLGGGFMVVGSPKQRNLAASVSLEQGIVWTREVFRTAVRQAEKRGVVVCFEPLSPVETNFINTAEQAIHLVSGLASPHFKIILDVKAMSSESLPIPEIIRRSHPHFAYVHANDRNLKGPGFGDVDFRPIAAALAEVRYDGYVSVEVFDFTEGPEVIARKSLEYLKGIFGGKH